MADQSERVFSLSRYLASRPDMRARISRITEISARVRTNLYQLTNECNLRCRGCWYYAYGMDKDVEDEHDLDRIRGIFRRHVEEGVTHGLIIGGEPTLYLKRLAAIVEILPLMSVATNGYRKLPVEGFENVSIGLTLFAGYRSDDDYRGIAASGRKIAGLFPRALDNYRHDQRVTVLYAVTEEALDEIEPTVRLIEDNGLKVYFSYYRVYQDGAPAAAAAATKALLDEALAVQQRHPDTVLSHPYFIRSLVSGETDWGRFGYDGCATVSAGHKAHAVRLKGSRPLLPQFRSFAQDLVTERFCAATGDCETCRDSLAVSSWLLANFREHARDEVRLNNWIEFAESYWSGFVWSPLHWSKAGTWQHARTGALDTPPQPAKEPLLHAAT